MAKRKDARVTVILECTSCIRNSDKKVSTGISRYITQKNRHNTPDRLEFVRFVMASAFVTFLISPALFRSNSTPLLLTQVSEDLS